MQIGRIRLRFATPSLPLLLNDKDTGSEVPIRNLQRQLGLAQLLP